MRHCCLGGIPGHCTLRCRFAQGTLALMDGFSVRRGENLRGDVTLCANFLRVCRDGAGPFHKKRLAGPTFLSVQGLKRPRWSEALGRGMCRCVVSCVLYQISSGSRGAWFAWTSAFFAGLTRTWVQANAVRTGRAGLCAQANNLAGPARPVDKWWFVRFLCTALRTAPGWRNRGQRNRGQIPIAVGATAKRRKKSPAPWSWAGQGGGKRGKREVQRAGPGPPRMPARPGCLSCGSIMPWRGMN